MSRDTKTPTPSFASKTRFALAPVKVVRKLDFVARTTCIVCGAPLDVSYGAVMAVFAIGSEFVGCSCDACLNAETRAQLASLREQCDRGVEGQMTADFVGRRPGGRERRCR